MRLAILLVMVSASLLAQRHGAGASRHGFGNVVFPGTGGPPGRHAPVTAPGVYSNGGFASRLGATVSGYPGYTGAPGYGGQAGRQVVVVPWAYPAYYPQEQPNVVVVQQPAVPAQQQPQVIINQHFTPEVARAVVKEYDSDDGVRIYEVPSKARSSREESREPEQSPFLIALKDQTIYAAFTFWLEGETLHYVTPRGAHNQVSLDRVDRDFTLRLNRDRELPVALPARD